MLADHETEEILDCHIIGADAATLIQEVANAAVPRGSGRDPSVDLRALRSA